MKRKPIFTLLLSVLLVAAVLVGGTMAYLSASDTAVVNEFKLADVQTVIEEDPDGTELTKTPTVKNEGDSEVYVRARAVVVTGDGSSVPVSADDVDIRYNTENYGTSSATWEDDPDAFWIDGEDGWYYYNQSLAKDESTEPLFDGVVVNDEDWDDPASVKFDIYVYHESVVASAGDNWQDAFNPSSDGSTTE